MSFADMITQDTGNIIDGDFAKTIKHINGNVRQSFNAIFDNNYQPALDDQITATGPRIRIKTTDTDDVDMDSTFIILSQDGETETTYYVVEIHPDDNGITEIILSENQ